MIPNFDPQAAWNDIRWTLSSKSLFEKTGFMDGALFEDLSIAEQMVMPRQQEITRAVVEHFLLPKLSCKVELYEANTSHNRVRLRQSKYFSFISKQVPYFAPFVLSVSGLVYMLSGGVEAAVSVLIICALPVLLPTPSNL